MVLKVISEKEMLENIKICHVEHNETEWERNINFEYEGEKYNCRLYWSQWDGFEMTNWGNVPDHLKVIADGYIYQLLDDKSYLWLEGESK